jgi:hypothetical protein
VQVLISMLHSIAREQDVRSLSLIAFNMRAQKIVYRQDDAETVDFAALGSVLETPDAGTVNYRQLQDREIKTRAWPAVFQKADCIPPIDHLLVSSFDHGNFMKGTESADGGGPCVAQVKTPNIKRQTRVRKIRLAGRFARTASCCDRCRACFDQSYASRPVKMSRIQKVEFYATWSVRAFL